MKSLTQKNGTFNVKKDMKKAVVGFLTHPMIHELFKIKSIQKLKESLKQSQLFSDEEILNLIPDDSKRIIDQINQADYLYPHSNKEIHQSAKEVFEELKQTVKDVHDKICNEKITSDHFPIVIAGAGPLAPFYAEVASQLSEVPLTSETTLIFKDHENVGTFNVDSDLHLLQPGFLRQEPNQLFNLPLPSALVELGILGIPATWKTAKVNLSPNVYGKILLKTQDQTITADTVVLSLGLGESVSVIKGDTKNQTSISEISSDGGKKFRQMLKKIKQKQITINVVGNGGAVASTLHVINRTLAELKHNNKTFEVKINLWVNLSKGSLIQNDNLASHIAWMKNELIDFNLQVNDPNIVIENDPFKVGSFKMKHSSDSCFTLHGELFHYDFNHYSPCIDKNNFFLQSTSGKLVKEFIQKNSIAINCSGQANTLAAKEFKNFFSTVKANNQNLTPVLIGDEEGLHSLILELRNSDSLDLKSRLIIGTTQAIGLLRAWKYFPELRPLEDLLDIESILFHLQDGHTKASQMRHFFAYYHMKQINNIYQFSGGYDFKSPPTDSTHSMPLAMPGAVGVCHSRKLMILELQES